MLHLQDNFPRRLFRQLATSLVLLVIVMVGLPGLGRGSLAHAGIFDIFKSKRPPRPTPEQLQAEEANRRRDLLRTLQMQHDSENDPARQIAYDRQIIAALDPYVDFEKIRSVQNEIQQHEAQMKQREQDEQKRAKAQELQQALSQAKKALEEHRYEDAERAALRVVQIQDDAQTRQRLTEARTRRVVEEAKDMLAKKALDKASGKNQQALQHAPNDPQALELRRIIDNALARNKTVWIVKVSFIVLLIAGLLIGLYFLLQPRPWVLAGIHGACQGQVFPLDLDEVTIGALGPPDGPCDIVIYDAHCKISRRHCVIVRNGRHWELIDESTNGTKINDTEVEKRHSVRLHRGDRLALADAAVLVLQPK
jgi:FHA domain